MARYKPIDTGMKLLPIDLSRQLLPGTFEHALSRLIDHELDLRVLDERFRNDITGAPAYAPAVLLKVILFAYARGLIRSRDIAQACQENVVFMTLSGDTAQQAAQSLHAAWKMQGGYAVEALLHDAQHREARALRVGALSKAKRVGIKQQNCKFKLDLRRQESR